MHSKKVEKVDIQILKANLEARKKILQEQVDEFLKNKDNSLEDRWEVWTKYSQKNQESFYHSFPEDRFPGLTDWGVGADGGYPSRYQTVDYSMIVDADEAKDYDDIREYLMEQNLGSFTVDW